MTAKSPGHGRRVDPLLPIVIGVAAGIGISLANPRAGMLVVAGVVALAAVLRLVLRESAAGLLVSRRRRVDVAVLGFLATALLVLALVTPFHGR